MRRRKAASRWARLGTIDSESEPGVQHPIERHLETGTVRCDCLSYRFARTPKTCKHLAAFGMTSIATATLSTPVVTATLRESVVYKGERFTARRAIAFGGVPLS